MDSIDRQLRLHDSQCVGIFLRETVLVWLEALGRSQPQFLPMINKKIVTYTVNLVLQFYGFDLQERAVQRQSKMTKQCLMDCACVLFYQGTANLSNGVHQASQGNKDGLSVLPDNSVQVFVSDWDFLYFMLGRIWRHQRCWACMKYVTISLCSHRSWK